MKSAKIFYSILLTLLTVNLAFTQVTSFLTGVNGPWGITIQDDIMYIGENGADRVSKVDLNQSSISSDVYVTGISGASSLLVLEDTLFIGERNGNRISKYTLTESSGDAEACTSIEFPPVGLAHRNGSIYIAEREGNKISKINIQMGCGSGFNTVIGDISQAYGIAVDGDLVYCSDSNGGFVFSFNLNDKQYVKDTIIDGLMTPAGLLVLDDQLYIAEFAGDRVVQVSLTETDPSPVTYSTGAGPIALAADSAGNVYISEITNNRISRINPPISNTEDLISPIQVNLYPNPAHDLLRLESVERFDHYQIRDIRGTVVQKGTILADQSIDVKDLRSGSYYLSLDNSLTLDFIIH